MSWNKRTESLRPVVLWECKDIPPDLVLSIIQHESGGIPGRIGSGRTKCGKLSDVHGNEHEICHALGLMQTIPDTVNGYNANATGADVATIEDMTGTDERAKRIQIRVGCKYLATVNYFLHKYFPVACPAFSLADADAGQVSIVLTGYAVGHNATAKKLQELADRNIKLTFANLKKEFPNWGKNTAGQWLNRPIHYASVVAENYQKNIGGSFDQTSPGSLVKRTIGTLSRPQGAVAAILVMAGAGWLLNRYYFAKGRFQ